MSSTRLILPYFIRQKLFSKVNLSILSKQSLYLKSQTAIFPYFYSKLSQRQLQLIFPPNLNPKQYKHIIVSLLKLDLRIITPLQQRRMTQYQRMYEAKCHEYEELAEQYAELQQQTNLIINDLESELKQVKHKNELLSRQINDQKQKSKCFKSSIEREVDMAQRERNEFKKKFIEFEKKVIQLEIVNQSLQSDLRSTKSRLSQYQSQTQKTMQELALAQLQLEQTHQSNKQTVARLRGQLKQAEEELYALHQVKQPTKQEQPIPSEVTVSEPSGHKQMFRQTLRGIRDYMAEIQSKKAEARRTILKLNS